MIENIWLIIMLFKWLVSPKIVIQPQAMKDIRFLFFFFFLVIQSVQVSLRTPQLIPGSTEHPASPIDR